MNYLEGLEKEKALNFINKAKGIAQKSSCERSKCGSVIVGDEKIVGEGFNSPPADKKSQRRCKYDKKDLNQKITDKTCCVHAEQRAIMDALKRNPSKLKNSILYFVRLDRKGDISFAGKPYCTICSKMALDVEIKYFVLYHKEGIAIYNTEEYNTLSYQYLD